MTASSKISVGPLELEFSTAKMLGAVGALFLFAGYLVLSLFLLFRPPYVMLLVGVLFFVGIFLVDISLDYYSKLYGNPSIYTNFLYAQLLVLGGGIITIVAGVAAGLYRVIRGEDPGAQAALAVFSSFLFLVALFLYYRALTSMAVSSRVELFRYAGLSVLVGGGLIFAGTFLLIGTFLLVRGDPIFAGTFLPIILIGFLFMPLGYLALIANAILLLFAFLETKEPQPSPPPQPIAPGAPA